MGIATGVMKPLLSKPTTLLEKEYAKFKSVHRDAQLLRDEMRSMEAALETLAEAEQLEGDVKVWRDDVRELSFDTEDCIDDFMALVELSRHGSTSFKKYIDKLTKLKPRVKIGNEIEEIKRRLIETSDRHKSIDGPKDDMLQWFQRNISSTELKVLSIVGAGGLGKTTLANQVYHTIKHQFSCTAFVSVSRKPDIKKILRDIAKGVGINDYASDDDATQLIDRIRNYLQDKRYLIVIDDVWGTDAWNTIWLALKDNNCGSRIIATTRKAAVASHSSSQGGYYYKMEPLTFPDSKRLFFERAFGAKDSCYEEYSHLEQVSKKILEKCAGLPLAIITLSSLLAGKTAEDAWNNVLASIGSVLANDPRAEDMSRILSLSYFDLPQHLRTCLLYLSVFPEDYVIYKQTLINRWIAEGFIHKTQGFTRSKRKEQSAYEIGEGYFNELINRSLILPVDVNYGQAQACRVHDFVLDFITCKATEENFVTSFDDLEQGQVSGYKARRLSIMSYNSEMATISARRGDLSHIRSLTVFGDFVQNSMLDSPALRVLDLGECRKLKNHHLAYIDKFFLLKYLRIRSDSITEFPEKIRGLQYLETLDVQDTHIDEVPSTITGLQRLARLYVPMGTPFRGGIIGQMQSLEEVEGFGVDSELGKSLLELRQLTKLKTLSVTVANYLLNMGSPNKRDWDDIHDYVGTLLSSNSFHHLAISYSDEYPYNGPLSLEAWCPTTRELQKLYISVFYIDKVPSWIRSLGSLRELELSVHCLRPEDVHILGATPALVFLKLKTHYGRNGRIFIRGGLFTSLQYLNLEIEYCGTALEFEAGSMPKLEDLKLTFKPHTTKCLNGAPSDLGIQHLYALTKVHVSILVWSGTGDEVESLIKAAVGTLPNHPTVSIVRPNKRQAECRHFTETWQYKRECAALTEKIGSLQIEEHGGN